MPIFQYLTFVCDQDQLQARLTEVGLEGWRLHTCEPVVMVGLTGSSGLLQILVVMDRVFVPEEEAATEDDAPEGIEMKS